MASKIYGIHVGNHFGDMWRIVSGAILLSKQKGETVYISRYRYAFSQQSPLADKNKTNYENNNLWPPNIKKIKNESKKESLSLKNTSNLLDVKSKLLEILDALDSDGASVEIVNEPQNQFDEKNKNFIIPQCAFFCSNPPVQTKIRHNPKEQRIISLQLSSLAYSFENEAYLRKINNNLNDYRTIPCQELEKIYANLLSLNDVKLNFVGEHDRSITNSIKKIAESRIFIGMCSGMGHLATSVGLPVYLYNWRQNEYHNLQAFFKNKGVKTFNGCEDLIEVLRFYNLK